LDFDPLHPRAGISTSEIHFIISKMVSAVRADATEVAMSKHKSSSTNGLPAACGKVHPNFENKKKISEKNFLASTTTRYNTLTPLVKSVFKSVDN